MELAELLEPKEKRALASFGVRTLDQLLRFAWKFMFPLALANLAATVVALWLLERA